MSAVSPSGLLARTHVSALANAYVLGATSRRVTFHDQQCRAFNLVWALIADGRVRPGERIAVVGGGLAGMTAAAAAAAKGIRVTLIERTSSLMHLQRGNLTRYVHPLIYDWPHPSAEEPSTSLPFLNWHAAPAGGVVDQIDKEWLAFAAEVEVLFGAAVTAIVPEGTRLAVVFDQGRRPLDCDCAILAVGFGIERTVPGIPFRSYWSCDDLHQDIITHKRSLCALVSGCGDGGLVDAVRLCLRDFNHATLVHELLSTPDLDAVKQQLLDIEQGVAATDGDVSEGLYAAYSRLAIPSGLVEGLRRRLRPETRVYLNGSDRWPFSLRASILNRFLVFLLLQQQKIQYLPGRVERSSAAGDEPGPAGVVIRSPAASAPTSPVPPFDLVVVRHGPEPCVDDLIGKGDADQRRRTAPSPASDITRTPVWPADFYPRPGRTVLAPPPVPGRPLKPIRIAALLNGEATYARKALDAFVREAAGRLAERHYDFDHRSAVGDPTAGAAADQANQAALDGLVKKFGKRGPTALLTVGTGVTEFAVRHGPRDVPLIYTSVTDAVGSGFVRPDELLGRDRQVCGVSFPDTTRRRLDFLNAVVEANQFRRAGFVYHSAVAVDVRILAKMQALVGAGAARFEMYPVDLADPAALAQVAPCDVYFGWLHLHLHLSEVLAVTDRPVLGGALEDVRHGCFAGIGPDDSEMGSLAAGILYRFVTQGPPLGSQPIPSARNELVAINRAQVERMSVRIPESLWEAAHILED